MKIKFWGTRGSIPTPGPKTNKYGGNTPCVEVRTDKGTLIIFDAGTGIRHLGDALMAENIHPISGHLFLSHTHWDHIQGLPFFAPIFDKENIFYVYAPEVEKKKTKDLLAGQMTYEYFPVPLDRISASLIFRDIFYEEGITLDDAEIIPRFNNHNTVTLAYKVKADGKQMVYCTDIEPYILLDTNPAELTTTQARKKFIESIPHRLQREAIEFFDGVDLLVYDTQYTADEYKVKRGWGHSFLEMSVDVGVLSEARRLALFHHEPLHEDALIDAMEKAAKERVRAYRSQVEVFAAKEGMEIFL